MKVNLMQKVGARYYMGYLVLPDSTIINKRGQKITPEPILSRSGLKYYRITLSFKNKPYRFMLHRFMAMVYIGIVDGYQVNHLDRNPENNHINNLEIVTASENQKHWREDGKAKNKNNGTVNVEYLATIPEGTVLGV